MTYGFVTDREPQNREKGKVSFGKYAVNFGIFFVGPPNPILTARAVFLNPLDEFEPTPENRLVKPDGLRHDPEAVPHSPSLRIDSTGVSGFAASEKKTLFFVRCFDHTIFLQKCFDKP